MTTTTIQPPVTMAAVIPLIAATAVLVAAIVALIAHRPKLIVARIAAFIICAAHLETFIACLGADRAFLAGAVNCFALAGLTLILLLRVLRMFLISFSFC